jgi:hypothetical protein
MAGFAWDNGWATSGEEQMKLRQARAARYFCCPALRSGAGVFPAPGAGVAWGGADASLTDLTGVTERPNSRHSPETAT